MWDLLMIKLSAYLQEPKELAEIEIKYSDLLE